MIPIWLQTQRDLVELVNQVDNLRPNAKILFADLVQAAGERGCCYFSNGDLGAKLGVGPRAIRSYLADLERLGWVACRQLDRGACIPGGNGEAVEHGDGLRLVVIPRFWRGGSWPGHPEDRRPPAERKRRRAPSQRSSGEDRSSARHGSPDPDGEDRTALRKGEKQRGKEEDRRGPVGRASPAAKERPAPPAPTEATTPELDELFEERAAIFEYEGGFPRHEAERMAREMLAARRALATVCRREVQT